MGKAIYCNSETMRGIKVQKGGNWEEKDFADLKGGDVFIITEPCGDIVNDDNGNFIFIAKIAPYLSVEGYLMLAYKPAKSQKL